MIKKIIAAGLILASLIAVLYYLLFYAFSGVKTALAKACNTIEVGMRKEEARNLMKNFENKDKVFFEDKNNTLSYTTPGLSGDYQCYIYIDGQNKVKYVTRIFD